MDIVLELQRLLEKLHAGKIPYALCGGFALAVYGIVRATEDIDLLVEKRALPKVRAVAENLGFRFNRQPLLFKEGALQIYRLHKTGGEDFLVLDLLLVTALTRPAWITRQQVESDFGMVSVVSPAGLIHLKSLRGSGQDQDDMQQLRDIGES